jgi:hypothetical protein
VADLAADQLAERAVAEGAGGQGEGREGPPRGHDRGPPAITRPATHGEEDGASDELRSPLEGGEREV